MDPHHRKIDLQSNADLLYLQANILHVAQQKLDLHIPPSAAPKGEDDAFRNKVDSLVHQFIQQTLTLALPSLSINGMDASPAILAPPAPLDPMAIDPNDPNYEPYDPRLATKLRELYATLEAETTRVAELRREAPGAAARGYAERLQAEMQADDKAWEAAKAYASQVVKGGLEEWRLARATEIQAAWERGTRGLEELRGVTEDVARLERAKKAAAEVTGS